MTKNNAPIAMFVFKRPEHTRLVLESLQENPEFSESPLFIYCDGARNESESSEVEAVRKLVREWPHPNKVLIENDKNKGLANSIIQGVTEVVNKFGRIIVVEDDLVTSPFFLKYMNDALEFYKEKRNVISIHGYAFPIEGLPESYFIKGASCWGWATWARGWDLFESDGTKLYKKLKEKNLFYRFDINGNYPYKKMLKDQISGKNNSWAIRWYASALIEEMLTLHPGRSLVANIGVDGSGAHCKAHSEFDVDLSTSSVDIKHKEVVESKEALEAWSHYLHKVRIKRYVSKLTSILPAIKFNKNSKQS